MLINLIKERYISPAKRHKYLNKFVSTKTMVFFKNTMYMCTIPLIKLSNFRKRKMHITHHCTPNVIYACILSHGYWKSPERALKHRFYIPIISRVLSYWRSSEIITEKYFWSAAKIANRTTFEIFFFESRFLVIYLISEWSDVFLF